MAGFWVLTRVDLLEVNTLTLVVFSVSLLGVVVLSSREVEVKRVVAVSTVIMCSFLWLLVSLASEETFTSIAVVHAAYKSTLFVLVGRVMLVLASSDTSVITSRSIAYCLLPVM